MLLLLLLALETNVVRLHLLVAAAANGVVFVVAVEVVVVVHAVDVVHVVVHDLRSAVAVVVEVVVHGRHGAARRLGMLLRRRLLRDHAVLLRLQLVRRRCAIAIARLRLHAVAVAITIAETEN